MRALREYIAWQLLEAAKTLSDASTSIALCNTDTGMYVVYDAAILLRLYAEVLEDEVTDDMYEGQIIELFDSKPALRAVLNSKAIYGIIELSKRRQAAYDAYTVTSSAAERGWGPMMYDLALSIAGPRGIMPDRADVSHAASNVWRYYATQRHDVKMLPIDDIRNPKTPPREDDDTVHRLRDEPWLDNVYIMPSPVVSAAELLTRHNEFVRDVIGTIFMATSVKLPEQSIETHLSAIGVTFFRTKLGVHD